MTERDSSKRIRLTVQGGPTREFPGDRTFVIGRSQNADFSIPHPNLSREHVRISLKNGEVWMEDLGSANGTFVQGQRVPAKSLVKIKPHYRILLGTGSNVLISLEAIDEAEAMGDVGEMPRPRGDMDLAASHEVTRGIGIGVPGSAAAIKQSPLVQDYTRGTSPVGSQKPQRELELTSSRAVSVALERPAPTEESRPKREEAPANPYRPEPSIRAERPERHEATRTGITRTKTRAQGGGAYELDFPQQHFPQEAKKEKLAELRIIEAKKQRVIEDIQYKEREVDDLRSKIRVLREEAVKLKEQTDGYRRELAPMERRREELEQAVSELDQTYEERIDALESGFEDLKQTLEESHSVRMARADKDHKEKMRRLDEEYARKLQELESGTKALHADGEALRTKLTEEKRQLEEALKRIRDEKEAIEAERNLAKVRIDTEMAQMQGARMKLENELEGLRRDRERIATEARGIHERVKREQSKLEEAQKALSSTASDRDSLLRSIEEIKLNESQNLRRIDEMRATVATLEGRAKALETTVRQAEHDAEAIRRKAKEDADQYRQAMQDQAESERAVTRKNAEAQAAQIAATAETQAAARLQAAEAQAAARLQAAEAQATARVQAVEHQLSSRISTVDSEIAARVQAAETNARMEFERAQSELKAQSERVRQEADLYANDRKKTADEYYAEVHARANSLEQGARTSSEKAIADLQAQLDHKRRTMEAEIAEIKRRADHEVRQVRAAALAEIEGAKEREAREFTTRIRGRSKEIASQIDRVVGAKLSAQFGVTMDPVTMKAFSDEIVQIVDTVLGTNKVAAKAAATSTVEKTYSSIMPISNMARDKAARYWKKMGIAAAVVAVLIGGKIAVPEIYASVWGTVAKTLEVKDNTDEVVRRVLRERQLAMTFVTEQDRRFRDSYTDNVLYTEAFIEMKEDIETQKQWTLELNKYFQDELGLTEKAIVSFGSAEGRMFRELLEARKNLTPATAQGGIVKMREIESGYVAEIKNVLRTEGNWSKFLAYHRGFYEKYAMSLANRVPAAAKK